MKNPNLLMRVLSLLMVLGVLTTACGAPAATEPATQAAQTEAPEVTEAPATTEESAATEEVPVTGKMYDGVTVNLLTFVGPQVAEPLQRRGPDFTELTGATINVITVPNSELYQKALTDMATGTNAYDAFLFAPSWIVDFAPAGYIEDLTPHIEADPTGFELAIEEQILLS
jgi:ABC-type glycerol-3-phosphate transport system substrate-binding protein